MAESDVKSFVNLLGKILAEEGNYLWGAEGKVEELRDELLWMRSFLRKADALQHKDEIVWMWVCQVQKYVYEAEDIIDKFVIKVVSRRRHHGLLNKLMRYSCIFRELYNLHCAASGIDSLKDKISTLSTKLDKYGLMRSLGINTDQAEKARTEQIQQIHKNIHMEVQKIVGLEKNAKEIIDALKSKTPHRGFHAIYGLGGSGKTTLATKVFKDDEVKQHFPGGRAFAYISKQFHVETVLRDIHQSLDPGSSNKNLSKKDLVSKLQELLKKKCLVVLDDVWTKQDWDSLKATFTSCGTESGSKLLLTTRKEEVAKYVDPKALQKPDLLDEKESWELLQETMGWDSEESSTFEQNQTKIVGSSGVSEKIKLGEKMIKVCKGLPLAIVVLGGILRKKQTAAEWESVLNNITSHLLSGYDHGRSCREILLQSYDDLPYHLKPCFLHLANFPEDYEIQTENLYWMWVAEGLVTWSACDRTAGSKSMEDVANDYLDDLVQAGLVQIEKASEGWIESIRMHDIVRDVCLEKATCDNFLKTIDLRSFPDQHKNTSEYYSEKRLLRIAIHLPTRKSDYSLIKDCISRKAPYYLRSLLFVPDDGGDGEAGECQELMALICSEFQLLRVLVLRGIGLRGKLSSRIGKLVHLRYLSLEGSGLTELPSSIAKLRFLSTLDLRVCKKLIVPNTLWKLSRLRHLLLPDEGYEIKKPDEKLRIDTLVCLERIEGLQVKNLRIKDLLKVRNLRKLAIQDTVCKEVVVDIIAVIKAGHIQSCVLIVDGDVISKDPTILSLIGCNCTLMISGLISVPENFDFPLPHYLKDMQLIGCQLKDDPMRILGSLCHLQALSLSKGSYIGTKMGCCHSTSFPLLTRFEIEELENLEVWELEHGSMPKLERLSIYNCDKLIMIPDVLPLSLKVFRFYNNGGGKRAGVNADSRGAAQIVSPYGSAEWLEEAVLQEGECNKVVILGKGGAGKETSAMVALYWNEKVYGHFDVVARTWVPTPTPSRRSSCLIPRRNLQQLLKDLSRAPRLSKNHQDLSRMSRDELTAEIQLLMQQNKCLVILFNLEVHDFDHLEAELEKTFGRRQGYAQRGSKLVITSPSHHLDNPPSAAGCRLFRVTPPTLLQTWEMLNQHVEYCYTHAGIMWNIVRHCPGHPLSTTMFVELLKKKENIAEWASQHKELTDSFTVLEFSQIFAICYNDLPLPLRRCLIYLANFPGEVEISTTKLCQLWIAAGFVGSEQDHAQTTQESLENLASTYLLELVERGMVTGVKQGPTERVKTCQLKYALRDLCLAKAKEDHMLLVADQPEHTTPGSNPKFKTQELDLISLIQSVSLDEQLNSVDLMSSPTSLVFFPDVSDPLHNVEKWEWLRYICTHYHFLRVLDVEGMWMTKGSLPKEVGELKHLRYLSLRGTWVTQLPSSIQNLTNLQTLDLRVLESVVIPDVLWKLNSLVHLYLPEDFIAQETSKLRLFGLNRLQTLVNLHTDIVHLDDLHELKLLRKISIAKIHAVDVVDELDDILNHLSTSLEVCISGEIINAYPTMLARFKNLYKLKIKGTMSAELNPDMFPAHLEELTLKHTNLKEDPLPVLEKLPKLRSVLFDHESFLGKELTFPKELYERANLILCSLNNLETLYVPDEEWYLSGEIEVAECQRVDIKYLPTGNSSNIRGEEEQVHKHPGCFDLACIKKGFQSTFTRR